MDQKNYPTPTTVSQDEKAHRLHFILLLLLLLISPTFPTVGAQSNPNNNFADNNNPLGVTNFSPSMAIIIVVLVAALFFMAFFSIYIRHCSNNSGDTVRRALSMHTRRANAASRGLDAAVVETFPTFTYAEVKDHKIGKGALECAVCLNEFEESETLRLIPKCDHVFHTECIDAWLASHVTCPVCRADLTPLPGDESHHIPDAAAADTDTAAANDRESQENNNNPSRNDEVTIQIPGDESQLRSEEPKPAVKRNFSFDFAKRPPRAESVRRGRFGFARSHSTGHSSVQPGENMDRFTLRLPERIRKEMMSRALLNRTKSFAALAGDEGSSRRGPRTGFDEGSSRSGRSYGRIERGDRVAISDRWIFSRAPSFFSRAVSIRSPRVTAESGGEGSTSKSVKATARMPSVKCLEPKTADQTGLVANDSARPPV